MPHVNKKNPSEKWKFNSNKKLGLEWAVNGLGKPVVKIRVKLLHVNKKPLPRNRIFVKTPFSHSTLKLERKKFTSQNHSLFRSISCFGVTKITTPIWLQKSWKCVNRFWKKRQRPNTIQILWIVKKIKSAIIAGWEDEGGY